MIRKLRIKFVAINMTIVTAMLCVILGVVFSFTKANLESESIQMMKGIAASPFRPGLPSGVEENVRLPYFIVHLGVRGEIVETEGGYYDLSDDESLQKIVDQVMESPKTLGVLQEYHLRYYRLETPMDRCLVFADISSELSTLNHLVTTCAGIGILSFLVFLGISVALSEWAVRPVDDAWKRQRQFVADASHELKTPLTVIMTSTDLALDSDDREEEKRLLGNILTMSHQMKGLIGQLLELARADQAERKRTSESVDLGEIVEAAVMTFEPIFFEKGLTLESRVEKEIRLKGDRAELTRLTEVLLDNASKYSKPGGKTWAELSRTRRGHCLLTVSNEGETIPKEELSNIFRRFYRADPARSRNGSYGLGLSIAESIVMGHGGKIYAQSEEDVNCFLVELPCIR